jgi:hypothetical protein
MSHCATPDEVLTKPKYQPAIVDSRNGSLFNPLKGKEEQTHAFRLLTTHQAERVW